MHLIRLHAAEQMRQLIANMIRERRVDTYA